MRPEFPQTIVRRTDLTSEDVQNHLYDHIALPHQIMINQCTQRFVRTFEQDAIIEPGKRNS